MCWVKLVAIAVPVLRHVRATPPIVVVVATGDSGGVLWVVWQRRETGEGGGHETEGVWRSVSGDVLWCVSFWVLLWPSVHNIKYIPSILMWRGITLMHGWWLCKQEIFHFTHKHFLLSNADLCSLWDSFHHFLFSPLSFVLSLSLLLTLSAFPSLLVLSPSLTCFLKGLTQCSLNESCQLLFPLVGHWQGSC